jgi:hypothetical protein
VTTLLQRMHDELVRRNYAATTIRTYLHALRACERYHRGRRHRYCSHADGSAIGHHPRPKIPIPARASGFLQVSLSRVTRYPHPRVIHPREPSRLR